MTSIKINRLKLIESLEKALKKAEKELKKDRKELEKRHKRYESELLKWEKDWANWQNKYRNLIPNSQVEFRPPLNYAIVRERRYWTVRILYTHKVGDVELHTESKVAVMESDLPQKPERPGSWSSHENKVEDIIKILKLLKMSDEEKVSTKTYKNVAEFL